MRRRAASLAAVSLRWRYAAAACLVLGGIGAVTLVLWPMDSAPYFAVKSSGEMVDRNGQLLYPFLNGEEQWCFSRDLDDISLHLINATIAAEDQRFYTHPGVDGAAIFRALWQNTLEGGIASGASTLTMQVVKMHERGKRSLINKAGQAIKALRLERRADKEAILEAYLNKAPYGLNLVGCESASRRFFGKCAAELTIAEAALLAGLPKAPTTYLPIKHPERAEQRRAYVLRRMLDDGYIDGTEYEEALATPVNAAWHEFPQLAPHLAMNHRDELAAGKRVATTLDLALQERVGTLVAKALPQYDNGITNAAVLVVDTQSAAVLARVGSAHFYNTPGGGQFDAVNAVRSPGSTLKPFTYAAAIENNLLYPTEMLLDGTLDYGLYNPENFDGNYRGVVSASYALQHSLNVPAVTVVERAGVDRVYSLLSETGFSTLKQPAQYYGLGLTLGNCEVTLEDLTAAYTMLANLGAYRPLRTTLDEPPVEARQVLARSTSLALYEMLEQVFPAEMHGGLVRAGTTLPRAAWKTGTSTGYHDAWTVAFNQQYVVGVWLGNNSGRGSPWLVGARSALPLAGRIFRTLPAQAQSAWPDYGSDMRETTLCSVSGLPVSTWCKRTTHQYLPAHLYLNRKCDMHYPEGQTDDVIERWPGSARAWDLASIKSPVVLAAAGEHRSRAAALRITDPPDQAEFMLTGESNGDRIVLRASLERESTLYWYANDQYLGASTPDKTLAMDLRPGKHTVTCMAPGGTTDTITFSAQLPLATVDFRP